MLLSRHPCLPCCRRSREQQGPFAPRALPRFVATADPSATLSSSADFPVLPVIRPTQLPRISPRDEEGFSSCSLCPCRRAVANHPAGVTRRIDRSATCHAAFAFSVAGSASGTSPFRGHHAFTAVTARRLAPIPRMGLSMGFRSFGFPPACHPATGLPIITPTGLSPAGHSSLFWTHNGAGGFPALRSPVRFTPRLMGPTVAAALSATPAYSTWYTRPSLPRGVYLPSQVLQRMGAFIRAPLPPILSEALRTAGLLRSTGITPSRRYCEPIRHPLVVSRLPGAAGYTAYPASALSGRDEEGFSSCLLCPCRRAVANHPAGVIRPVNRLATDHAAFTLTVAGSASGTSPFRGHHAFTTLRPGDSHPSRGWGCQWASGQSVSLLSAIQLRGFRLLPRRD